MTTFYKVNFPGHPASLHLHFGGRETTIITSGIAAAAIPAAGYAGGWPYPDLLVAFDVDPAAHRRRNGYLIPEQGKPPDFVLEVASEGTARRDETVRRGNYAAMGIPEYWRFDDTGGKLYQAALAGDRLADGEYRPIPVCWVAGGGYWGHSEVLGLDLCWIGGELRFWDPEDGGYLAAHEDLYVIGRAAEAARAEAEARLALELASIRAAKAARAEADARLALELAAIRAAETARAEADARLSGKLRRRAGS